MSVDSMQVYRGMDIGTAKPTAAERAEVPQHLLDLLDPWEEGTVAWFQREAHAAIVINLGAELRSRLRPPCRVLGEAGILITDRSDTYYQADLAVTCAPPDRARQHVLDPVLLVEVLSPSTAVHDRGRRVEDYSRLPSVR